MSKIYVIGGVIIMKWGDREIEVKAKVKAKVKVEVEV